MRFFKISLLLVLLYSNTSFAHGPTRQKVKETIEINTASIAVWKMIKKFEKVGDWHTIYSSISSPEENLRNFVSKPDGSKGSIEILSSSDDLMRLKYRLKNPASIPVNNYSAQIIVQDNNEKSIVTFKGAFYRKYVNNDPPPGEDDEAAIKAVTEIYKSSLKELKTNLER